MMYCHCYYFFHCGLWSKFWNYCLSSSQSSSSLSPAALEHLSHAGLAIPERVESTSFHTLHLLLPPSRMSPPALENYWSLKTKSNVTASMQPSSPTPGRMNYSYLGFPAYPPILALSLTVAYGIPDCSALPQLPFESGLCFIYYWSPCRA